MLLDYLKQQEIKMYTQKNDLFGIQNYIAVLQIFFKKSIEEIAKTPSSKINDYKERL